MVTDVGESAFEDAEGFETAVTGCSASSEHGAGGGGPQPAETESIDRAHLLARKAP